jgi:serine/threonine-protein kinase RsbW
VTHAPMPSSSSLEGDRIEVRLPARPEYVAVVRLMAGGIAGRVGLSVDDAEDLKLAVGEACNISVQAGAQQLTVSFEVGARRLGVRVVHDGKVRAADPEGELGLVLMQCLMDQVVVQRAGPRRSIVLTKVLPG